MTILESLLDDWIWRGMRVNSVAVVVGALTALGGHVLHGSSAPAVSQRSRAADLAWTPLAPERVCEVRYDHLQGDRFRHVARFERWRADKPPAECGYDQLATTAPYELRKVFGGAAAA